MLFPGPDSAVVKATAESDVQAYIEKISSLGYDVARSGLFHALHQGGVQNVILNSPTADIILPKNKYSKCTGVTINIVEFRDV